MKNYVLSCLALLPLILTPNAGAAVIHVPADQPTIQQAIDAAATGDTVLVAPGTYFENIDYHGKEVIVKSQRGASETTIDGNNAGPVITFQSAEGSGAMLIGFTIQHGSALFGAGITIGGGAPTPIISRNAFRNNAQGVGGFGAAIGGNFCSPTIDGNLFISNTCDTQFDSGVVSFVNSSSPLIVNNVFLRNPCRAVNLTVPEGNSPVVANNTIVGNTVGLELDLVITSSSQIFANNIIVGNDVGVEAEFGDTPPLSNNLVWGNGTNYAGFPDPTGTNGNISANPQFVSLRGRDFQLTAGSPAIDAGTLSIPGLPRRDFLGDPRVIDGDGDGTALPDMGAYEFSP